MTQKAGLYFLLLLLAGASLLVYFIFAPFLSALILAVVFAVVLQPLYRWILSKWRHPSLASLATVLVAAIGIITPLSFLGTQIAKEAADVYVGTVYGNGSQLINTAVSYIDVLVGPYMPATWNLSETLSANLTSYAEQGLQWILAYIGPIFSGLAGFILGLFIFLIALYYLLRDGGKLRTYLIELSPLADSYDELVFSRLEKAVNAVMKGSLAIALIQGTLSAIGFYIFGVPNPVLWGAVTAIASLVPGIGTALVFIPIVLFLFVTGNIPGAIGLAIWGAIAVGLADNFLSPYLIGSGTQLHPLLVLVAVLGGLAFFGAVGLFLGPIALSLLSALLSIYSDIVKPKVE